jgi:hypothetical protein
MDYSTITFLGYTRYALLGIALVAIPFGMVNSARHIIWLRKTGTSGTARWTKYPIKSTLFFVVPFVLFLAINAIIASVVRSQVLDFLESLPAQREVIINGQPAPNTEAILSALKTLAPRAAHHSGPTSTILIEVRANGNLLNLRLGRDSRDAHEYWVFSPSYSGATQDEIGRISTPMLDGY